MAVTRCRTCRTPIEWLRLRNGKRLPFESPPAPVDLVAEADAWTIVRAAGAMFVVPLTEAGSGTRAGVRHVLVRHDCRTQTEAPDHSPR